MKFPVKKSLGQHFLFNPTTVGKILSLAAVKSTDRILEIGPGPGVMTRQLSERAASVVAVEKDRRLAQSLSRELAPFSNLTIVEADILEVDLEKLLGGGRWKVIANLPYNIATETIFHLFERHLLFESFYLMAQKEVAERLTAEAGSRSYGLLSIFSQLLSENRIVLKLPPGAFTPPPKVHSALVEFRIHETPRFDIHHLPTFEKVVQAAFGQRRKMIRKLLKDVAGPRLDEGLKSAGIPPSTRAEAVSIGQFTHLANFLSAG